MSERSGGGEMGKEIRKLNLFDVRPVRVEGGEELEHVNVESSASASDGGESWFHLHSVA